MRLVTKELSLNIKMMNGIFFDDPRHLTGLYRIVLLCCNSNEIVL